jgi:hypothetical protein
MTTPYIDPQTVHNPATGTSPPASWGDTVRDNQQLFSRPPSVKAVRTAVQSLATATFSPMAFTAADEWDTDNFHSTTVNNTRITVPSGLGGTYHLIGNLLYGLGADSQRFFSIRLNGSADIATSNLNPVGANGHVSTVSVMYKLAAGDYIELSCFQSSGVALNITGTLSAHWVSL